MQDLCLLGADWEAKVVAGSGEAVHALRHLSLCSDVEAAVVCEPWPVVSAS